ncbi:MAG: GNAT family N-acetyltransferase [Desulfotignum sp.]|nr:GNAT family N-acetyltransferase [Desulfotignum sp.]MCF8114544.1 GNAT family N-acetyltransferase [Desulfotignum sp.]MCF8125061.1 GNAT family N-acetyltransferase [Desulfotignum sp.]
METKTITTRLMKNEDFDAVVRIDTKVLHRARPDYYQKKFQRLIKSNDCIETSLVAEDENGTIVGFIMGELIIGDFGICRDDATVDTMGVDPEYQRQGIGKKLMADFMLHLKELEVEKLHTLVDKNDDRLMRFYAASRFSPSETFINMERII